MKKAGMIFLSLLFCMFSFCSCDLSVDQIWKQMKKDAVTRWIEEEYSLDLTNVENLVNTSDNGFLIGRRYKKLQLNEDIVPQLTDKRWKKGSFTGEMYQVGYIEIINQHLDRAFIPEIENAYWVIQGVSSGYANDYCYLVVDVDEGLLYFQKYSWGGVN